MDHSFNDRVDKVFGSISSSSSSTPWSLTDAQVERRVWKRDKANDRNDDDETPVSSSFDNLFNNQRNRRKKLDDLSDDEDIGGDDDDGVQTENDGDEWDIRSSIGLDSTLDNEEEEDAYDKMAEGRENAGDRLYMKDVTEHGPYLNSHNILPNSIHEVKRDPRANLDAAKTRLKEDNPIQENPDEPMLNAEDQDQEQEEENEPSLTIPIKSILKRKNNDPVKPSKRVRFDPACKNEDEATNPIQPHGFSPSGNGQSVPDYVLNPSKYTRYDFNDFSHGVKDVSDTEDNSKQKSGDLPDSIVFIPRKKRGEEQNKQKCSKIGVGIGIAALEVQQGDAGDMQEDELDADGVCTKKNGRRYRSRMEEDDQSP